jgi:hypothetical protein
MKNKKMLVLISSIAFSSMFVLGGTTLAAPSDNTNNMGMMNGMVNGNAEKAMMNSNGMDNMMEAIASSKSPEMMKSCGDSMDSKE